MKAKRSFKWGGAFLTLSIFAVALFFAACNNGGGGSSAKKYTAVFDANGGSFSFTEGEAPEDTSKISVTKAKGESIVFKNDLPGIEHPEGKEFYGWAAERNYDPTSDDSEALFIPENFEEYVLESDIELYAVWVEGCCKITLMANGGTFGEKDSLVVKVIKGQKINLKDEDLVTQPKKGKAFLKGWTETNPATLKEGEKARCVDQTFVPEGDMTLYAVWRDGDIEMPLEKNVYEGGSNNQGLLSLEEFYDIENLKMGDTLTFTFKVTSDQGVENATIALVYYEKDGKGEGQDVFETKTGWESFASLKAGTAKTISQTLTLKDDEKGEEAYKGKIPNTIAIFGNPNGAKEPIPTLSFTDFNIEKLGVGDDRTGVLAYSSNSNETDQHMILDLISLTEETFAQGDQVMFSFDITSDVDVKDFKVMFMNNGWTAAYDWTDALVGDLKAEEKKTVVKVVKFSNCTPDRVELVGNSGAKATDPEPMVKIKKIKLTKLSDDAISKLMTYVSGESEGSSWSMQRATLNLKDCLSQEGDQWSYYSGVRMQLSFELESSININGLRVTLVDNRNEKWVSATNDQIWIEKVNAGQKVAVSGVLTIAPSQGSENLNATLIVIEGNNGAKEEDDSPIIKITKESISVKKLEAKEFFDGSKILSKLWDGMQLQASLFSSCTAQSTFKVEFAEAPAANDITVAAMTGDWVDFTGVTFSVAATNALTFKLSDAQLTSVKENGMVIKNAKANGSLEIKKISYE